MKSDMPDLYGARDLTKRELEIVRLVADGLRNPDIAELLGISEQVIKNRLGVIFDKCGVWSRLELALWYLGNETKFQTK